MNQTTKAFLFSTLLATIAAGAAADLPAFAQRIRCDVDNASGSSLDLVTWQQGTTPLLDIYVVRRGKPIEQDTGTAARLVFGAGATGPVFGQGTNYTTTNNSFLIQMPTIGTNTATATNGLWWFTVYFEKAGRVFWTGNGALAIEATTSTGADGTEWITPGSRVESDPVAVPLLTAETNRARRAEAALGIRIDGISGGGITNETDPVAGPLLAAETNRAQQAEQALSLRVDGVTNGSALGETAAGWGNHASAGYMKAGINGGVTELGITPAIPEEPPPAGLLNTNVALYIDETGGHTGIRFRDESRTSFYSGIYVNRDDQFMIYDNKNTAGEHHFLQDVMIQSADLWVSAGTIHASNWDGLPAAVDGTARTNADAALATANTAQSNASLAQATATTATTWIASTGATLVTTNDTRPLSLGQGSFTRAAVGGTNTAADLLKVYGQATITTGYFGRIYCTTLLGATESGSLWLNNGAWRSDAQYFRCEGGTTSVQLKYGNGTHARPAYESRASNGTGFNPGLPTDPTTAFIDAGGFPVVTVTSNGWVGINQTNPAVALAVVGAAISLNGTNYTPMVFTNSNGAIFQVLGTKLN